MNNKDVISGKLDSIGFMPPKKEKKLDKKRLALYILIVAFSIFFVAFLVYFYLNSAKQKIEKMVTFKEVVYSINDKVSTNLNDYATFTGINYANCSLDLTKVNTAKTGKYDITIYCSNNVYKGFVSVSDLQAPEVKAKESYSLLLGEQLDINSFIESCSDADKCLYNYENEELVNSYLNAPGIYDINIIVSDPSGNKVSVTSKLDVYELKVASYYTCTQNTESIKTINNVLTKVKNQFIFSLDINNNYLNIAQKKIVYSFLSRGAFNDARKAYNETKTFDGHVNNVTFNNSNSTVEILIDEKTPEYKSKSDIMMAYFKMGYSCS